VIQKIGATPKTLNSVKGGTAGQTAIFTFSTVAGQTYLYQLSLPVGTAGAPGTPVTGTTFKTTWSADPSPAGGVGNRGTDVLISDIITVATGGGAPDPSASQFIYSQSGYFVASGTSTVLNARIDCALGTAGDPLVATGSMVIVGGNQPSADFSYCIITPVSLVG
jgi:hypothetical protein